MTQRKIPIFYYVKLMGEPTPAQIYEARQVLFDLHAFDLSDPLLGDQVIQLDGVLLAHLVAGILPVRAPTIEQ